jgi:hypothetical protein
MPEPKRSRLRRLLEEHPRERRRIGRAVASLLGTALVGLAAVGALLIWHLVRRGRLIRAGLGPPRAVSLLDIDVPSSTDPDLRELRAHDATGDVPTA